MFNTFFFYPEYMLIPSLLDILNQKILLFMLLVPVIACLPTHFHVPSDFVNRLGDIPITAER